MVRKNNAKRAANGPKRSAATKTKRKQKEMTILGGLLRGLGGIGGGTLGGMVGNAPVGASLGTAMGGQLSKWLGSGDYEVNKNSLILKGSDSIPAMHNQGQSIIVRHKEYITDITSSQDFSVYNTYPLNPGLSTSFPWLATVAQNFVEYTWRGVVYHYVPTSGASVASTNTALGSVMMATNYRATAPEYTNKQTMLNEFFASDARPTEVMLHPIECDPRENPYNVQYIRTSDVPEGEDQKTYDLGVTTVATQGMPADSNTLGELWVSYEVELRKPKAVGTYQLDSFTWFDTRSVVTSSTGNFGTTAGSPTNSRITVAPTTITFDKNLIGRFLVIYSLNASSITAVSGWSPSVANGTLVSLNFGLASSTWTATTGTYVQYGVFESLDPTKAMVLTSIANVFVGTTTGCQIRICEVNALTE